MKKLFVGLCCMVAFCAAVIGISGCQAQSASLAGTWDFDDATVAAYLGEDPTDEQKAAMKTIMFLNLNDDGTLDYVVYGESMTGTWEQTDEGVTLTIDGDTIQATLNEGKLEVPMDEETDPDVYEKAEEVRALPTEEQASEALSTMLGFDLSEEGDSEVIDVDVDSDEDDEFEEPVELNDLKKAISIADDDKFVIKATATGTNGAGDPGYNLSVKNKTDKPVYLVVDEFTVDGNEVLCYGGDTVDAGKTADIFIAFDSADLGEDASVDSLKAVEGTLEMDDDDTMDEIATYGISIN